MCSALSPNGLPHRMEAGTMLSYVQGEDGMDSLQLDFFERDFSVKDSGERL